MLKNAFALLIILTLAAVVVSCRSTPEGTESGAEHTVACFMHIEASVSGVVIQTNHTVAGQAPLTLKVFGDISETFHSFGSPEFVVTAVAPSTNYFTQTKSFRAGKPSAPGDRIPGLVYFDMSQSSGGLLIDSIPSR